MRRLVAALVLTVAIVLSGCASVEDLVVADVPDDELRSGWSYDSEESGKDAVTVGPLTVAAFSKQVYRHQELPSGAMAIVTVSDVPLADVQGRIREEFQNTLDKRDVERSERRTGQLDVDGHTADYTLYDAEIQQQGTTVTGYVLEYTYTCSDSGTVVGFLGLAAVEAGGFGSSEQTWNEVAGSNWREEIGGMAKQVECRA